VFRHDGGLLFFGFRPKKSNQKKCDPMSAQSDGGGKSKTLCSGRTCVWTMNQRRLKVRSSSGHAGHLLPEEEGNNGSWRAEKQRPKAMSRKDLMFSLHAGIEAKSFRQDYADCIPQQLLSAL
jgi:hypothetical protein